MKKTNRLASLFLALLLAFSYMAVPAMAEGEDGIMPLKPVMRCPNCSGVAEVFTDTYETYFSTYCNEVSVSHRHAYIYTTTSYICTECGDSDSGTVRDEMCLGGNCGLQWSN